MHINVKHIILILLLTTTIKAFSNPVLDIQSWTTEQGVQVLFTEAHELPMVDLGVIFYAGSARDGNSFGLASFTSSMLKTGTKTLTADQVADKFDQVGAGFGAYADNDTTTVSLRCLTEPKILDSAVQTFISVLTQPAFREREFQRVKKQILTQIQWQKQDPMSIASEEFYKKLYGDFPYNHSALGTQETVTAIKIDDLHKFYHKYYVAKNALVVIVGDVTKKQAESIVDKIISKLPIGVAADPLPEIIKKSEAVNSHIDFPAAQVNAFIGQIGIAFNDTDYFPLSVGNYILGGSAVSELFQKVRENRGLVYAIYSYFATSQKPGPFAIGFSSSNEKAQETISVSKGILQHFVQNGPTAEQLIAAKTSLIGRFPLGFSSNASIRNKLSTIGVYHLPLNYFDTYVDKINMVTLEQIREAFKRHIDLNGMITVTVGKKL